MVDYKEIKACRSCQSEGLKEVLDLGEMAISTFGLEAVAELAPLRLVLCSNCQLVQLKHTVEQNQLYRNYWFRSFLNPVMRRHLQEIVYEAMGRMELDAGDVVVDIGANDGTLLSFYPDWLYRVGFEPAGNLLSGASVYANILIPDFFNLNSFKMASQKKAKVITSIAMFYDLNDPNRFVQDIKECLANDGLWVIEMLYLPHMIKNNAFDTICHEHLAYYSLTSLQHLLNRNQMEIESYKFNPINGGSFRVYVRHGDISSNLHNIEKTHIEMGEALFRFADRIKGLRRRVMNFLIEETAKGKRIFGYGASTKGNTFLQYSDLSNTIIQKIADRSSAKWGLKTVATNIPIISEADMRAEKPDYLLVLIWQFRDAVIQREMDYLKAGGKMIFALPLPELVYYENERIVEWAI